MAATLECRKVEPAVNGVGGEHSPEKHDFGDQEDPNPEGVGLLLLFEVLELVSHPGGLCVRFGVSHRQPPRVRRRTLPRLPRGFPRSFPLGGETRFSIRDPWRPTDSVLRSARSALTTSGKRAGSDSRLPGPSRPPMTSHSTPEIPPDRRRIVVACPDSQE